MIYDAYIFNLTSLFISSEFQATIDQALVLSDGNVNCLKSL